MLTTARRVRSGAAEDKALYGLIGAYLVIANAVLLPARYYFATVCLDYLYSLVFLDLVALPSLIFIGLACRSILADPAHPTAWLRTRLTRRRTGHLLAGFALLLALVPFMSTYTWLKSFIGLNGFHYDTALANLDRALHFGVDPANVMLGHLNSEAVWRVLTFFYGPGWMLWVNGVVFWMACLTANRDLRRRFFIGYLFAWAVLGGLIAWMFISAGPAYFAEVTGDLQRFAPAVEAIRQHPGTVGMGVAEVQAYLWSLHVGQSGGFGMGISAFPSLHLAMVTLCALTLWEASRCAGVLAWIIVAITLFTSVAFGWHYAVDGYFSIGVMSLFHHGLRQFVGVRWRSLSAAITGRRPTGNCLARIDAGPATLGEG